VTIRLYDSARRDVRDLEPLSPGRVGIYLCGLTVQAEPHVGHIRSALVFDVLRRWLEVRGYQVDLVRNITDIDDKILISSAEQGRPWYNLAYAMRRELDHAYDALHLLPPAYEPFATGHVPEIVELIARLVERGHAYPAADGSGDVYFDVLSWPSYGELSGQRVDEMEPAADADPRGKRDPRDFALWKGWKADTEPESASWPSPWGRGRPGWHIECSAMALKYLGREFDIHGGGVDLRFPHHENELAQSRAAGFGFAARWMHNAWITTAGDKMSKSLGNSLLVPAVLRRNRALDLRFYMVASHYRSHVEFSFEALDEAAAGFGRIESFLHRATELDPSLAQEPPAGASALPGAFAAAMDDDLSTPAAVAVVYDTVREGNRLLAAGRSEQLSGAARAVRAMLAVLGLDPYDPHWSQAGSSAKEHRLAAAVDRLVSGLVESRAKARADRDFATADAIRDQLRAAGVELEDTPQGPRWSLA
jgi:cysteinyl-tRNA synthetase